MSVGSHGKSLATLTKGLSLQWQATRETWKDAKSLEFEQKYLVELQASVDRAVTIFDQLDKLLAKVRNDCE